MAAALAGVVACASPRTLSAQFGPTLLGAAGGTLVGGYTTIAIYVTKARFGRYVFSPEEVLSLRPEILPLVAMPIAGAWLGAESTTALARSAGWGALGLVAGATVGGVTGKLWSDAEEAPWAGALIGAGAGLLTGVILGALDGLEETGGDAPVALSWSLPVGGP